MEGRCDLVLLGWTAFVGLNLISDFLWSGGGHHSHEVGGSTGPLGNIAGVGGVSSTLYRGHYRLLSNGSLVDEGSLRLTMFSQPTGAVSVRLASLALDLLERDNYNSLTSSEADLIFSGVELSGSGKLTATGSSDPTKFQHFGVRPCRLDAVLDLSRTKLGSAEPENVQKKDILTPSQEDGNPTFWSLTGEVVAEQCGFSLAFVVEAIDILYVTQKVVYYSIWVNVLTILQIRCFMLQMRHTDEGPSAAKVSILCIAIQVLMDAYDSFLHLCLGLSSQYMFNTIAIVALFKFILFSVIEARYFLTIWRQRRHEAFNQGWEVVRRELSWMYSRFYGALVMGLVLIYNNLRHLDLIVVFFQGYWLPQIFYDAWQGSRSALSPAFVCGISITRALHILYLWGCPKGVFNGELYPRLSGAPSLKICLAVVLLQGAQLLMMMMQRMLGPRWFIPWICMPQAYNYYKNVRVDAGTECVICMSEIDPEDARKVTTPCSHMFHNACLQQWMDVKMECPTCRNTLPPIQ